MTPKGRLPASPKSLIHLVEIIPPGSTWSVIGIGIGRLSMITMGIMMGGPVRDGLENNIYYARGILAESNARLVERIVRLAHEFGREWATPVEARQILT